MGNMKKVLQFEMTPHPRESRCLDKILHSILLLKISARFGQWYASGVDLDTNQYKVFRCDHVTSVVDEKTTSC